MIINSSLRDNLNYGSLKNNNDRDLLKMLEEFKVFNESKDNVLDLKINNKSLSTGQMQKISFIRALLNDIEILLLDESLSNVDMKTKESILEVIGRLEVTIINVTHNLEDFEKFDSNLKIEIIDEKRVIKSF